jgi:RNA polymerase-binding protein DksA
MLTVDAVAAPVPEPPENTAPGWDRQARKEVLSRMLRETEAEMRARLRSLRSTLSEASAPVMDPQEAGVEDLERDLEVAFAEIESSTLKLIGEAMQRLEESTYGLCRSCGGQIGETRLEALPFTSLCRDCQERTEDEPVTPYRSHRSYEERLAASWVGTARTPRR